MFNTIVNRIGQVFFSRIHYMLHIEFFRNVILRNRPGTHLFLSGSNTISSPRIIAMLRVRNESLLISDTLDHLASFADGIVIYDDASNDNTVDIALAHSSVIEIIVNKKWRPSNRIWEETANRRLLYRRTLRHRPEWVFYSDADERFEGNIRDYLLYECADDVEGVRVRLLDAYITEEDKKSYRPEDRLWNFRTSFGVERRDILMAWRANRRINFTMPDSREPSLPPGRIETRFWCQHYGKSLSIEQWEETCHYYINHFPTIYSEKWIARLGKAVHTESDFGTPLYSWNAAKMASVQIN